MELSDYGRTDLQGKIVNETDTGKVISPVGKSTVTKMRFSQKLFQESELNSEN